MINLKAIITQLDNAGFNTLMNSLGDKKKTNYSFLLEAYRDGNVSDEHIIDNLNLTTASFYTLKSRLYDKIQNFLLKNSDGHKFEVLKQVATIPELCYSTPRETAIAILNKLEQDLIKFDMPAHLVQVYSALKKINNHTPKYYQYSQLFNKHLAYTVALEKAEELLHNFNKSIADYFFSKNSNQLDLLKLIGKEIKNIFTLNSSHHIELIKNNIFIQLQLFCNISFDEEKDTEELLNNSFQILEKHPNDSYYRHHQVSLHFLYFEYYKQIKQFKKAATHFDEVNNNIASFFLLSSCCFASKFLFSKIEWYAVHDKLSALEEEICNVDILKDENDKISSYAVNYHTAIAKMLNKKNKEAGTILNNVINTFGFKDYLHSELEVKLVIAYLYVIQNEYEMASNNIRSIYRKIKSTEDDSYENALAFCKLLNTVMNDEKSATVTQKIDKAIKLFEFENSNSTKPLLDFIFPEMKKNLNR